MKIFLDTADVNMVRKYNNYGIIDGVTTNPALIARQGLNFKTVVEEICSIVDGPVSAEVVSEDYEGMVREAHLLAKLHRNIVVKLPANHNGYRALNALRGYDIKTNLTVVYSANQALIAAKLGATYVSPFVGRLDANSTNGVDLIKEIALIYKNYNLSTQILAASMRNVIYVKEAALAGAHVATIPPEIIDLMMVNELADISLSGFLSEWHKLPAEMREYFK